LELEALEERKKRSGNWVSRATPVIPAL